MTQIIDGYAQPDIEATKGDEHLFIFVETPISLPQNAHAIARSYDWIHKHYPNADVELVHTVPKKKK